jgi:hypothetical protein
MNRNPAHAPATLDHQNGSAQLGGLDGSAPTRRSAANHDKIICVHGVPPCQGVQQKKIVTFQITSLSRDLLYGHG